MYYSSGNYEAFAHPKKPEGVDHKSAYIIGTGLAALSAACYLVRDGQMKGERIHIFEKDPIPGGACDGFEYPGVGYVMRGGREMDNHFEVMWESVYWMSIIGSIKKIRITLFAVRLSTGDRMHIQIRNLQFQTKHRWRS